MLGSAGTNVRVLQKLMEMQITLTFLNFMFHLFERHLYIHVYTYTQYDTSLHCEDRQQDKMRAATRRGKHIKKAKC